MKKILSKVLLITIIVTMLFVMNACQTGKAKEADAMLQSFLYENDDPENIRFEMSIIDRVISNLSDKELKSLKLYDEYQKVVAEYIKYEDEAVKELEEIIAGLPNVDDIRLADEEAIDAAASKYDSSSDAIKGRVSNVKVLEAAKEQLEKHKEACWVECSKCSGDGRVTCSLCNGSGTRWVNHTTPNGKTWRVTQDCKTTTSCGACNGTGGIYVEEE